VKVVGVVGEVEGDVVDVAGDAIDLRPDGPTACAERTATKPADVAARSTRLVCTDLPLLIAATSLQEGRSAS